jgi:hypothetical protein
MEIPGKQSRPAKFLWVGAGPEDQILDNKTSHTQLTQRAAGWLHIFGLPEGLFLA